MFKTSDFSDLGLPIRLARPIFLNSGRSTYEGVFRPKITSKELSEELTEITGLASEGYALSGRVFEFDLQERDQVIVRAAERNLPLIIRRGDKVIANFDICATQAFRFPDSKRPIYTYIPGFNIQKIPTMIRRPVSNFIQSLYSRRKGGVAQDYSKLPLTSFEFVIFLMNKVLARGLRENDRLFRWPKGKKAVFISLHDVDTGGFLRRKERDPLFVIERRHQIRSTWFIPTGLLKERKIVEFLLQSGNEVGWHGHKHDHRLPFGPFAKERVEALKRSFLAEPANFPTGMRTPKLLKSNHLFNLLEQNCPALSYDTTFSQGIVPYNLWVNGRESKILEIPITVPTDIGVYNKLHGIPRSRSYQAILEAQIARTRKLIEVGGVISIVTHPEMDLTERPEFLDIYEQYLLYVRSCPNIWFATAGELFRYWTKCASHSAVSCRS